MIARTILPQYPLNCDSVGWPFGNWSFSVRKFSNFLYKVSGVVLTIIITREIITYFGGARSWATQEARSYLWLPNFRIEGAKIALPCYYLISHKVFVYFRLPTYLIFIWMKRWNSGLQIFFKNKFYLIHFHEFWTGLTNCKMIILLP